MLRQMTADELAAEFYAKAVPHSGTLTLLQADDAIELVRRAAELHISVLGVDGFVVSAGNTASPPEHIAGFSARGKGCRGCWTEAEAFILQRAERGLVFEIGLGRTLHVANKEWFAAWGAMRTRRLWSVAMLLGFVPAWLLIAPLTAYLIPGIAPGIPAFVVLAAGASFIARRMWASPCPRCSQPFGGWTGDPWPDRCSSCGLHTWAAAADITADYERLRVLNARRLNDRFRRALAVVEVASGVAITGVAAWFVAKYGMLGGWVGMAFESYAALSIAAGVLLWRNTVRGFELSELLQWLQIVRFQTPAFSFVLTAGPEALAYLSSEGSGVNAGIHAILTVGRQPATGWYVAVNAVPVLMLLLLTKGRRSLKASALGQHATSSGRST